MTLLYSDRLREITLKASVLLLLHYVDIQGCPSTLEGIRAAESRSENDANDVYRIYEGDSYEAANVHKEATCYILNCITNLSPTSHCQNLGGLQNLYYGQYVFL